MKRVVFCWVCLFLIASTSAQEKSAGAPKAAHRKKSDAAVPACKNLDTLAALVDGAIEGRNNGTLAVPLTEVLNRIRAIANAKSEEEEKNDPILAAIRRAGTSTQTQTGPPEDSDSVWNALIDCSEATMQPPEQEEALRVAAVWELLRADAFQKAYRDLALAQPVPAPACKDLDQLRARVKAVTDEEPSSAISHPMQDYDSTLKALRECMNESVGVSKGKPDERYWSAVTLLSLELWEARRARAFFEQAYLNTPDYAKAQAGFDARQKGGAEQNEKVGTDQPAGEAASQCDQIVTVAGLTPNGLALYIPPEGQKFMTKNAKDYPRMCLLQSAARFVPGVPSYLLVWAYSENAFAGFQPVQQVTTSPVSGSGTVTNLSGDRWNFTSSGTLTEIDTVEAPYVIQSRSLYLRAYDEKGTIVSQHSVTTSTQTEGGASYAAGYNASALISLLWNNPSHLIKNVLRDVQKDSKKYGKK